MLRFFVIATAFSKKFSSVAVPRLHMHMGAVAEFRINSHADDSNAGVPSSTGVW